MSDRLAPPPDDRGPIRSIEISFAIPVWLSSDQERRLHALLGEIADSPYNAPADGVHWLAGWGCKPNYSQADSLFLGMKPDPDAPESGEPTYERDVLYGETFSRGFVSDEERDRVMKRREQGQ